MHLWINYAEVMICHEQTISFLAIGCNKKFKINGADAKQSKLIGHANRKQTHTFIINILNNVLANELKRWDRQIILKYDQKIMLLTRIIELQKLYILLCTML